MTASAAKELRRRATHIVVTTDQAGVVDQAEAALVARGGIYVRARTVVQVVRDVSSSHGLDYPAGQPVIVAIGKERLRELCGQSAVWQRSRGNRIEACMVPPWVASTLLERGEWRFPPLDAIADAPVFRADGTIHDQSGYDPATRVIYDPAGRQYPPVPTSPTRTDALRALESLLDPFTDFPFVAASDRAAVAALVLTLVARPAIDGCVPLPLVRAPTPGSGKGLLVDAVATIATGRRAPLRAPATNDEELRKALLAYAIESPALIVFDNVDGVFGSPVLAMALTAGAISDRVLGHSESKTVPIRFVMLATGNNVQLRGDVGRRVMPIDLDAGCEHPEDRGGWRHPELLAYVRAERPRFVAAALTVLRSYVLAGKPGHSKPVKGSYEAWDRLIRGAVIWAGGADPLGGVDRIRAEGDEELERLRALLTRWHGAFGSREVTIADAVSRAGASGELHDALAAYCWSGEPEAKRLGYEFRKLRGRPCGGLVLERVGDAAAGVKWKVRACG